MVSGDGVAEGHEKLSMSCVSRVIYVVVIQDPANLVQALVRSGDGQKYGSHSLSEIDA